MEEEVSWEPPRQYASVCHSRDPAYSAYDSLELTWGRQEDYEIVRKIGRGKYSDVFDGVSLSTQQKVIIKILKPVKKSKIKREVHILRTLSGKNNVIRLLDLVRDSPTKTPSLILEHAPNTNFKGEFLDLADIDLRLYLYEILRALDYTHSMGVMHRDIKPGNVMIDHEKRRVRVIDWGLADFYLQGKGYNVRVASRYYKAPELLLENSYYHYAVDMWGFGALMAGWVFKKEPFFHGSHNLDQLHKIVKTLGSQELCDYVEKFTLSTAGIESLLTADLPKRPWDCFVTKENQGYACPEALDLLEGCLKLDHSQRLLAGEALRHPYFAPVTQLLTRPESLSEGSPAWETAKRLKQRDKR